MKALYLVFYSKSKVLALVGRLGEAKPRSMVAKMSHVPGGTYRFKATLSGFQSVVGTITVSKRAVKTYEIKIEMPVGV